MNDCAVSVQGLWKRYDIHPVHTLWAKSRNVLRRMRGHRVQESEFWALRDVSFDVKRGETLGVIGPNGAGKSTLLKVLCGVTAPTRGGVQVRGRIAPLIELGAGFHPELTGRENVLINGVMLGMSMQEVRKKYDQIVEFSGLKDFMDTPVKKYSSGMFVRLGFSVAVHIDPEILLIDEVLAVGDLAFKHKCVERLQVLRSQGVSALFVSHNMHQVSLLCERAMLLDHGRALCIGPTDQALQAYTQKGNGAEARGGPISMFQHMTGVEVTSLALLDGEGRPLSQPRFGEPLVTRFTVRADRTLDGAVISHVLMREDGLRVAVSRTLYDCPTPVRIRDGDTFECRIEGLRVNAGRFHVEVVIHDSAMVLLARVRSQDFMVVGAPAADTGLFGGVFYHDVAWRTCAAPTQDVNDVSAL